jgi:glycosyltransferase involved in cell wall biosynthesis
MNLQFHLISFEGPDSYCRAGGLSTRVSGLASGLVGSGFETHVWFVGDPDLVGHEQVGNLHLHRWCQWLSSYHRAGVYDGEEVKRVDLAESLPPFLLHQVLRQHVENGGAGVVLAEEWQTADAVLHLDWLLRCEGLRDRTCVLWNANNTFGFDRIDWPRLNQAVMITTVSRFMKHQMWKIGVDPIVIPNGLTPDAFCLPQPRDVSALRGRSRGRLLLAKIARWDPDKRWLLAIDIVRDLKQEGLRPLLLARGGAEAHEREVLQRALECRLRVAHRPVRVPGVTGLLHALTHADDADVINLTTHLDGEAKRCLFRAADVVLANSGREPFGLVGLEAMAVGGLTCTGCTGEEYAVPGKNAIVQQTSDPREFIDLFRYVRAEAGQERTVRKDAMATARDYAWTVVLQRNLLPRVAAG